MNRKGFTLVELLATIIILSIVVGITVVGISINMEKTKKKTEEVFIESIRDAMSVYLSSPDKNLSFSGPRCGTIKKTTTGEVDVYKTTITFNDVISGYHQLEQSDLINPKDNSTCQQASNIEVNIYRDSDYVYYYKINKADFGCNLDISESTIDNLPSGFPDGCGA